MTNKKKELHQYVKMLHLICLTFSKNMKMNILLIFPNKEVSLLIFVHGQMENHLNPEKHVRI
jgi:hypothetical protein